MKALYASSLFTLIFLFGFYLQIESKTVYINPIPFRRIQSRLKSLHNETAYNDDTPRFIVTAGAAGLAGLKGFLLGLTKGSLAGVGFGAGSAGLGVLAFEHFNMSSMLNPANVNWTALSSSIAIPSVNLSSLFTDWSFGNSNSNTQNPICIVTRNERNSRGLTLRQKEANKPEIILLRSAIKQIRSDRNRIRRTQNLLKNRHSAPNRLAIKEDVKQHIITGETAPFERQTFVGTDPNTVSCVFIRRQRDSNEINLGRQAEIPKYKKIKPKHKPKIQNRLSTYLGKRKALKRRKLKRHRQF